MEHSEKPKRKFYKRWWFWVLIIIILLIIIGASSNTPQKIGTNGQQGASTSQTNSGTSQPQTFKVGDQIQMGSSVITVNQVSYSQGSQFTQPSAGNKWIDLNITIENNGDTQQYVTTLGQMYVRDSDGNSYQVTATDKMLENPGLGLDGAVIAKSKRTGWVGFEIPKAAKGLQFQYDGSIFGGGTILVDLGQ